MLKTAPTQQSRIPSQTRMMPYLHWLGYGALVIIFIRIAAHIGAESIWFQALGYGHVFGLRLAIRFGLFTIAFVASAAMLLSNIRLAQTLSTRRYAPQSNQRNFDASSNLKSLNLPTNTQSSFGSMKLWLLLPLSFVISIAIGMMVIYHGQVAISHWQPQFNLYRNPVPVPINFEIGSIWLIGRQLLQTPGWLGILLGASIALLIYPLWMLRAIALFMAVGFGIVISEQWSRVLLYFNPTSFEQSEPLFHRDISFYVFQVPFWELLNFWVVGVSALAVLSVTLIYLLSENSLSQGRFAGFSVVQLRHLYRVGSGLMMMCAMNYWLDRYTLLYSPRGVTYGASYTDVTVHLPIYTVLSILAFGLSILLLWYSVSMSAKAPRSMDGRIKQNKDLNPSHRIGHHITPSYNDHHFRTVGRLFPSFHPSWMLYGLLGYWAVAILGGFLVPLIFQRVIVQPNELQLETPYIERTIALTRDALNLNEIESETFFPESNLTYEDIQNNALTINNIRLWDTRPLLESNRQLQRIRLYYEFPDADVDRYTLTSRTGQSERRQVLISARELDYAGVSDEAKTWVNEHLIYTHGYGFTMSPVNTASDSGLPEYFIRDIEHVPSNDAVRRSIPIGHPRIYYGELTNTYVMTQTQVRELDFPSGSDNEYNTYDGSGGIDIGSWGRRVLFANRLQDWRMLLTRDFTPQTRLLYRRSIRERSQAIAPFLRFDSDPYLVVADITQDSNTSTPASTATPASNSEETGSNPSLANIDRLRAGLSQDPPNMLYWMIDAYTTTNRYPYADPIDRDFNYIRNSVKVVIDAYNGTTVFYVADESDPVIRSWERVFPDMFQPLSTMPTALREHIRYPQDFYQVQSQHLMIYHMIDPQVFYNREDEWRAPNEIYANEQQVVEPYYLMMELPTGSSEEFILLRPFTPIQRRNMIAWLAARSDGDRYGTQLLYTFPKQELVFGPEQIEARINQDPVISQQISLWDRQGSRAVQGNLLVIPIEESLLYVEPLYLEAEQNRLPTLVRVIVVFDNKIAMAPTLDEALNAIFLEDSSEASTILRSVEDSDIPLATDDVLVPDNTENIPNSDSN